MLKQRIITGVVLGALIFGAVVFLPTQYLAMVMGALLLIGAWEWTRLIQLSSVVMRIVFLLVVLGLMLSGWFYVIRNPDFSMFFSIASAFWVLALFWVISYPLASQPTQSVKMIKFMSGLLVLVPAWVGIVLLHGIGVSWLLYIMILMWVADSGAYFAGKAFGKRKLAPKVSPGKSWEGVAGALLATAVYAVIGTYWLNLSGNSIDLIIVSLVIVPVSVLGDLFESMIKRHSGMKDSGTILPGHGGILDRIDSLTASIPVFVLLAYWTGLFK